MLAEHHVHMRIFQHAVLDHRLGAAGCRVFFRRLEDQLHAAVEFILQFIQHIGCAKQHGRVGIVAAAVHHPGVLRGIREPGAFGNGQGVKVRAQAHAFAGAASLNDRRHAVAADVLLRFQTDLAQRFGNIRRRLFFLMAQFRMAVEPFTVFLHLIPVFIDG